MSTFGGREFVPMDTSDGNFYIYTDASAPVRGKHAGIGLYFGPDHPLTRFRELKAGIKSGEAEVFAATEALNRLWNTPASEIWKGYSHKSGEIVVLRSDCLTMIETMEKITECSTVHEPEEGKSFDNRVRLLIQLAEQFPKGVRFEHVYAGSEDEGIQAADRLATRASYGLTAVNRGHNHNRSRQIARREQRNFFCPKSFRVGKKFHVRHDPARSDEFIGFLQRFSLSDTERKDEEMRDPGYESGDDDLDSAVPGKLPKRKADEPEDARPAKKPRSICAIRLEVSGIEAKRLQDDWSATIRSLSALTHFPLSPGNRDVGHIPPHKIGDTRLRKPRNQPDTCPPCARTSLQSHDELPKAFISLGKRNSSNVSFLRKSEK